MEGMRAIKNHLYKFYIIIIMKSELKVTQLCPTLCDPYSPWNSPGQNIGVGSCFLLQGIFPTQGLNPGLPHCKWFLCQLRHQGRTRILEWVAYPFSSRSSQPRNQIRVSCSIVLPMNNKINGQGYFPGGPVAKIHCRGHGFSLWSGS